MEKDYSTDISSNKLEIMLKQLRREVDTLMSTTEAKLLLHDNKIAEVVKYIIENIENTLRCIIDDMDHSGRLEEIIIDSIKNLNNSVKNYGAKGDGVTDDTFAIQTALMESKTLYLPEGTYLVSEEITIPDDVTIYGENERTSIIKANNKKGIMNAVVRLSRSTVGEDTTEAVSGVTLSNLTIDAEGCDYGLYANYVTNESKLENLTVINSTKCNICIVKSWFATYKNLTAKKGKNIGISLGVKQKDEIEVGVNAITFSNIRSHSNGLDLTHDQLHNIEKGCGIIIDGCNNCDFDNVQSELNKGIGVIFKGYNTNHFASMYIENNSQGQVNSYGLYQTEQTTNGQIIDKLILASGQTILNESKLNIGTISRVDSIRTFYGEGMNYVDYMDYTVLSTQQDFSHIASEWHEIFSKDGVNIRYSTGINDVFINGQNIGYPFLMILPKESLESSSNLTILVNGTSYNLGKSFVKNTPVFKRLSSMKNTDHVNEILVGTGVSADLNANLSIGYFTYGSKKDNLPIKPF